MNAEELAAQIWPGEKVDLERLGGGITNHNFIARVNSEAYVLRIAGTDTELLGIDRGAEHAAAEIAADLGVGPEVVDFIEGSLVTRFVEGGVIPLEELRRPEVLRETAELLRRVHEGPAFPAKFDSFRVVEIYRWRAEEHGVRIPAAYGEAKARADELEQALGPRREQPCLNDLLNAHFIGSPEGIRIVDWEYAGMGDPFFDLANFSVNHELADEEIETLLAAYFGEVKDYANQHFERALA